MIIIKYPWLFLKKNVKLFLLFFYLVVTNYYQLYSQVYLDPTAKIDDRVNDLLGKMTLDEKVGQMLQDERSIDNINTLVKTLFLGSVLSGGGSTPADNSPAGWVAMYNALQAAALSTRLKIPIIYGIDAVHGHNNAYGAVIFPHNIGMGCTRDSNLLTLCTSITAMEVRATGLNWTFSPCIAVPRDIRWGRTYEGFGETPELQKTMAYAAVKGYQGDSLGSLNRILACSKHFVGDGGTSGGVNAGNTVITEKELRAIHLPGYIRAIEAGVGSIMVSYNSWNGVPCHYNKYLITDLLKGELGFNGFVVSDWHGIDDNDMATAVETGINAGIDMLMEPGFSKQVIDYLKVLVNGGKISNDRIDDAVKRILTIKFKLGLFEHPYADLSLVDSFGNDYHRSVARRAVRESQVLLTNKNDIVPLSKSSVILVAGSKADDIGSQCGGWSLTWQGQTGNVIPGTSILDAIKNVCGTENVFYSADGTSTDNADLAVVVVGETPYAEGDGDNSVLGLSSDDLSVINNVKKLNIPYVVILLSGRPLMIENVINNADAFIAAWLPGTEAMGITDLLFGDYPFTGKLSHSWPTSIAQVPVNYGDSPYNPFFPYGYGLTTDEPVKTINKNSIIVVYPNPADKLINIKYNELLTNSAKLTICNSSGEVIISKQIKSSKTQININYLSGGVYSLKIVNGSDFKYGKFVKQ